VDRLKELIKYKGYQVHTDVSQIGMLLTFNRFLTSEFDLCPK
jgi:hypothetical protein